VLDQLLPRYRVREYHETLVRATPEAALAALLSLPATSDGVIATLFALRGIRSRGMRIRDLMAGMGLHPTTTAREYAGVFSPTAGIRIGVAFWAEPHAVGARLATETRVEAGGLARVGFALYWLVIGPFSALIRRRWLTAAKRIAESAR
jgi:hypothetical protein